ncbi:hypothetical protein QAD02_008129 [Eretmocerus hayati]|uniref:Uncharacterized protein n=1 Tax=Eretmocerus hayati TaxID=131215 RepID=A0ACC2N5N2_9HYME|nr:hypothetical protein QAD02_008129 [Eretmocerus hayati]
MPPKQPRKITKRVEEDNEIDVVSVDPCNDAKKEIDNVARSAIKQLELLTRSSRVYGRPYITRAKPAADAMKPAAVEMMKRPTAAETTTGPAAAAAAATMIRPAIAMEPAAVEMMKRPAAAETMTGPAAATATATMIRPAMAETIIEPAADTIMKPAATRAVMIPTTVDGDNNDFDLGRLRGNLGSEIVQQALKNVRAAPASFTEDDVRRERLAADELVSRGYAVKTLIALNKIANQDQLGNEFSSIQGNIHGNLLTPAEIQMQPLDLTRGS